MQACNFCIFLPGRCGVSPLGGVADKAMSGADWLGSEGRCSALHEILEICYLHTIDFYGKIGYLIFKDIRSF